MKRDSSEEKIKLKNEKRHKRLENTNCILALITIKSILKTLIDSRGINT